ncbi:AfsR/SARP family transcriptional regulator [Saccharothrix algeriensis]|uniref:DNA-binding SARP family transcriptional activator/tetratricopeptide (TPR) repeat protein n=2 Tax=Saccharothrix algeriensis TaxID=173560 RepID=A0ABS2SHI3_9PSEU|nr:BTAD domain-containing putative transcriptional regulator [Saccharothrix algeriensis]MBM7815099.1 DNA-binding SARP family transcriptional activator/tetratricopeptide (TPR) repeat protein [Saccharothrix algeriensis]
MGLELRVLDGVGAAFDGRQLDLGHARRRCAFAALAVDLNRVVPTERLVERVWGEHPPLRTASVLRTYLSRLRGALAGTGARITSRHGGYALLADDDAVDLHRFRRLVGQARRHTGERALALLEDALALWGGEALAGVDTPWADSARHALAAERTAADADRIDLALDLGHHHRLLAELPVRAAADPLDERLAGQLVLALHRSGRSGDALRHYAATRAALVEHLGAEPGPRLRRLHQRILTEGAAPDPEPRPDPGPVRVPQQVPPPPPSFSGRRDELRALDAALAPADHTRIAVLTGAGGHGKTWLALRWADDHRADFPDGRLHADLRGFDPVDEPAATDAVTRGFLTALGVAPQAVPAAPDAQTALYRELTADRRLLVVLDNARDAAHVTPLLPGGASGAVLVTSRHRLTGLIATHAATPVPVDALDDDQAAELLARHLGPAADADPDATRELRRHCAGLPLALGVLAARAKARPDIPLAALAAEVRDASARLDALDTGELSTTLRAVFDASTRRLRPATARLFALLGLAPGPDIGVLGAAALAGCTAAHARRALRELEEVHLVHQHVPGRYRMHDLVRLHAGELAGDATAELDRLFDHYCLGASLAAALFTPGEAHRRPPVPAPAGPPPEFADFREAQRWLTAEQPSILAAAARCGPRHATHLSRALARYLDATSQFHAALTLHEAADPADGFVQANLGATYSRLGRAAEATELYDRALARAEATGDAALEHTACTLIGISLAGADREAAVRLHERALAVARRASFRHSEGISLVNLGEGYTTAGRYAEARDCLRQARAVAEELGDPGLGAVALSNAGILARVLGDQPAAQRYHRRAVELSGRGTLRTIHVAALVDMAGSVHLADGPAAALPHHRAAVEAARAADFPAEESRAREGLARALAELARTDRPAGGAGDAT